MAGPQAVFWLPHCVNVVNLTPLTVIARRPEADVAIRTPVLPPPAFRRGTKERIATSLRSSQ